MPTPEIGPTHPVTYRAETLTPVFALLPAGESAAVVASASMGKSRLVQFLLREDVAAHYLGDTAERLLLVWIDCNRLGDFTAWHLYELLLDALLAAVEERPALANLRDEYRALHLEVIRSENALLAQRIVERFTRALCRDHKLTLCLVLDEFDEAYARLPSQVLAGLRGLRDANKYRLCYLLFARQHPQYLRDPADCEGLYEQFSRNVLYLQPYRPDDARRVIQQLAERRGLDEALLSDRVLEEMLALSGGHPGLLVALLSGLADDRPVNMAGLGMWAQGLAKVHEECRKIYEGLRPDEQAGLRQLANGQAPGYAVISLLEDKGLVKGKTTNRVIFSPLFATFARQQTDAPDTGFYLDKTTGRITVNGQVHTDLPGLLYNLVCLLYDRMGEIVSRDDIASALYGSPDSISNSRIDQLIRRLRQVIEPDPGNPQFLKTVHGQGYRLELDPDTDNDAE